MSTHIPVDTSDSEDLLRREVTAAPARNWRTWLIGRPLATADAPHQTIGKAVGLAVFASDALSSTAYATQEILVILAVAGTAAFGYAIPISAAIVALLAIVTISYYQTIHAYPSGGGAYIVSRDNLGDIAALVAGAALLMDYILTVSVSISSGVAQLVSAYPEILPYRVVIAVSLVMLVMLINLRGVKESGTAFAIPTYFFLGIMILIMLVGFFRYFTGSLGDVVNPPEMELSHGLQAVTMFLILHAFSNGTTALTGVEAISNGITAFREPRSRNAGLTMIWMAAILAALFLGITYLSVDIGAVPSESETVISQLARTAFGSRGIMYLLTISATTIILIMAANTAYAGFPRLSALMAADGFLPRQLTFRGSRLVYSRGIVVLALIASLLIVIFNASVTLLIPLYAIGVFLSFTLSQIGMARRWRRAGDLEPGQRIEKPDSVLEYDNRWSLKMWVNRFGALCTAFVMIVFAVTKFADGAWIVLVLIPVLALAFYTVRQHYKNLAGNLSLEEYMEPRRVTRHRVVIPVSGVHRGTLEALNYARSISSDVTAVHVSIEPEESARLRQKWELWGDNTRLVVVDSPYRLLLEPLLEYIEMLSDSRQPGEVITVVVPQFVPEKNWANVLHTQTALWLRFALLNTPGIVITEVPYQVK